MEKAPRAAVTIGVLQGGGSLIGADLEVLVSNRLGLQVGAGLVGIGPGINYHLRPSISSSMISLLYWHQGLGDSYTQSVLGHLMFSGRKNCLPLRWAWVSHSKKALIGPKTNLNNRR